MTIPNQMPTEKLREYWKAIGDDEPGVLCGMPPEEEATTKIRIAVAMDEAGRFIAFSVGYGMEQYADRDLVDHLDKQWRMRMGKGFPYLVSFVEADVPLPAAPQTVEGTVTP